MKSSQNLLTPLVLIFPESLHFVVMRFRPNTEISSLITSIEPSLAFLGHNVVANIISHADSCLTSYINLAITECYKKGHRADP